MSCSVYSYVYNYKGCGCGNNALLADKYPCRFLYLELQDEGAIMTLGSLSQPRRRTWYMGQAASGQDFISKVTYGHKIRDVEGNGVSSPIRSTRCIRGQHIREVVGDQ